MLTGLYAGFSAFGDIGWRISVLVLNGDMCWLIDGLVSQWWHRLADLCAGFSMVTCVGQPLCWFLRGDIGWLISVLILCIAMITKEVFKCRTNLSRLTPCVLLPVHLTQSCNWLVCWTSSCAYSKVYFLRPETDVVLVSVQELSLHILWLASQFLNDFPVFLIASLSFNFLSMIKLTFQYLTWLSSLCYWSQALNLPLH